MRSFCCRVAMSALLTVSASAAAFAGAITNMPDWTNLVEGDKTFSMISYTAAPPEADLSNTTVQTSLNGGSYSLNNAGTDNIKGSDLLFSVKISGSSVFNLTGVSQNATFGSTAGSETTVYSDAGYSSVLATYTLNGTSSSSSFQASGLQEIFVKEHIIGDGVANITFQVTQTASPVPEPSTLALLGLGAVGLSVRALRRRRAAV